MWSKGKVGEGEKQVGEQRLCEGGGDGGRECSREMVVCRSGRWEGRQQLRLQS